MDLLLEMLEDPAYRHVLLNHLPIVGLAVASLVLAGALFEKRWPSIAFALALVAILSGSAIAVTWTGDAAYPVVYDLLDGPGRDWLDYHTYLGERWGWLLSANGALAVAALGLGTKRERFRQIAGRVVLGTTLVALVTAALIAEAGGKVRHPEFRLEGVPAYDAPGRIR